MEAAPTPSMALCFFGITADSVSHPSDSIRRSFEAPCCSGGGGCGCVAPEEDGAVAAGDDIAAAVAASGIGRGPVGKERGGRSAWAGLVGRLSGEMAVVSWADSRSTRQSTTIKRCGS
jgi:hypothetical protein